ncbi:hypothetical protein FHT70_000939 [Rhizobium sp. BK049]|nr:hypothetical protein [Rhizobium sp. BK049]
MALIVDETGNGNHQALFSWTRFHFEEIEIDADVMAKDAVGAETERQQPLSDEIGNGDVPAVPACHLAPALGEETHLIEAARFFRIAAIGGVEAMKRRDERLAGGARERTDDIAVLAEMGMDKIGLADRGKQKRQADLRDFQKQLTGPRNGRPTNVMNRDSRFFCMGGRDSRTGKNFSFEGAKRHRLVENKCLAGRQKFFHINNGFFHESVRVSTVSAITLPLLPA